MKNTPQKTSKSKFHCEKNYDRLISCNATLPHFTLNFVNGSALRVKIKVKPIKLFIFIIIVAKENGSYQLFDIISGMC